MNMQPQVPAVLLLRTRLFLGTGLLLLMGVVGCSSGGGSEFECDFGEFACGDAYCIPLSSVCDGTEDCFDGSDEYGCVVTAECGNNETEDGEVCDGRDVNEMTCAALNGGPGELRCQGDCKGYDMTLCACGDQNCDAPDETPANCPSDCRRMGEACETMEQCLWLIPGASWCDITWPDGGSCVGNCQDNRTCPAGTACGTDRFGFAGSWCRPICSSDADCRPGYSCYGDMSDTGESLCFANCTADTQCAQNGTTTCNPWYGACRDDAGLARDGEPCTEDSECESWYCLSPPEWPNLVGGTCVSECSLADGLCPGDGQCQDLYQTGSYGLCLDGCATDADCREAEGYVCAADGYCWKAAECGDGTCQSGEDPDNCPDDCTCGNGVCDPNENSTSCNADCYCGNGVCEYDEDGTSCPDDCACGNGVCDSGEDNSNCSDDCYCGNGLCDYDENNAACPEECAALGDPVTDWTLCEGHYILYAPGGMCTMDCSQAACPAGFVCAGGDTCYPECSSDADCRQGYACWPRGPADEMICWPNCTADAQCTGINTGVCDEWYGWCVDEDGLQPDGGPCESGADCESGSCFSEANNPSVTAGYCYSYCSLTDNICPGDGVCYDGGWGTNYGQCYDGCTTDADCRQDEGYICGADHMCWKYTICGDGTCQTGETSATCPVDCACGNGACDGDETHASCPDDCAALGDPVTDWAQCEGHIILYSPGGMCTMDCSQEACPTGFVCAGNDTCFPECTSDADCRDGYACWPKGPNDEMICWSNCTADAQCAGINTGVCDEWYGWCVDEDGLQPDGGPCQTWEDCESGSCFTEANNPNLAGGYCFSYCSLTDNICPGDAICFDFGWGTNYGQCLDGCTADADCRQAEGYACFADGACWSN